MKMMMPFFAQQASGHPLQPLPHPELPPPPEILPEPSWWIYAVAASLVVVLLGLVVWLLLRPGKAAPPVMKKPWQTAMNRLRDILASCTQMPPATTAAAVSETLRVYFMDRYQIPAPFRTTEEIFQRGGIPSTSLRLHQYQPLAALWDELAFAPVPADSAAAAALVQKAIAALEEDRA